MGILDAFLNGTNIVRLSFNNDPIKFISALSASGALIVGCANLYLNLRKEKTKLKVTVKRLTSGPLALQNINKEFIVFEVYNGSSFSVLINEVGYCTSNLPLNIERLLDPDSYTKDLVDLPGAHLITRSEESSILGSLKHVHLPGAIPPNAMGVLLFSYSGARESFRHFNDQDLSPGRKGYLGQKRLIDTFSSLQLLETGDGGFVQMRPYILTGSGNYFFGENACVKLGRL